MKRCSFAPAALLVIRKPGFRGLTECRILDIESTAVTNAELVERILSAAN